MRVARGALRVRGRPQKLNLQRRMEVRRRVREWTGPKVEIYTQLAKEFDVSQTTIERTVLG
jgi:hypothetical protein